MKSDSSLAFLVGVSSGTTVNVVSIVRSTMVVSCVMLVVLISYEACSVCCISLTIVLWSSVILLGLRASTLTVAASFQVAG